MATDKKSTAKAAPKAVATAATAEFPKVVSGEIFDLSQALKRLSAGAEVARVDWPEGQALRTVAGAITDSDGNPFDASEHDSTEWYETKAAPPPAPAPKAPPSEIEYDENGFAKGYENRHSVGWHPPVKTA